MRLLVVYLLLFSHCIAQDEGATKLIELDKASLEEILKDEGETVRVKGYVETTRVNATGINFLEFKDTEFVTVTFGRYVKDFEEGAPADIYKEKWIEITGEIEKYRGIPQIKLLSPDQVKILKAPAPPKPEVTVAPKKEPTPEEGENPELAPVVAEVPKETKTGPVLEVVDGVPALDWRKYFPE